MIIRILIQVSNVQEPNRKTGKIEAIVDTGSTYCWIPKDELKKIGVLEYGSRTFKTITGEKADRPFGSAWFTYDEASGGSEVVLPSRTTASCWVP